jgi:hypothetical protein
MKKIFERILSSLTDEDIEFTSNETTSLDSPTQPIPSDDFHTLITTILNKTNLGPINEVNETIESLLHSLDLMPEFQEYLLEKYKEYQSLKPNHTQEEFIVSFGAKFKNTDLVELLPFHAKKINFKVEQAYYEIVKSIKEIQKEIPQSNLRTIAESDLTKVNINRTKLHQCNTPFCLVVLKCSGYGQYNIVYAIDKNSIDQIGNELTSNLLRKIYEHTSHELSKFLQVYSLKDDCFSDFEEVLKMSASKDFIRITQH